MTTTALTRPNAIGSDMEEPRFPAGISLVGSQMRSTNLERDVQEPLHDPYIGARAVDVLDRLASALKDPRRTRAWSLTGPYGSGKSTLANIIHALLGDDEKRRTQAEKLLDQATPGLGHRISEGRNELASRGFLGAVATARREPLTATLARALHTAAQKHWPQEETPSEVSTALANCADPAVAGPQSILEAIAALCAQAPMLLVIDEFGKTLEHLAAHNESASAEDDLFLLQEIAERSAGRQGHRLYLMTLQHLSFMDYAARSSDLQTREWAKVQGRFEDITFTPHLGDAVQLMRRRLDHTAVTEHGRELIDSYARAAEESWREHGLNAVVDLTFEDFADLYPLHPLTAIAAPYLAAQIGQHDRSLANFLNSDEPNTVRRSLEAYAQATPDTISTIRLPQLYDFFLDSGRTSLLASSHASRWIEVESRIDRATGMPARDQEIMRAVGMLNLMDSDGALRATTTMVYFALHDPQEPFDAGAYADLQKRLDHLKTDKQLLVLRDYSGEYRVWEGTDVNIDKRVEEITKHLDTSAILRKLKDHLPAAVVAGRHSQVTGMQRALFVETTGPGIQEVRTLDDLDPYADGLLVFHFGNLDDLPTIDTDLPVVLGTTDDPELILGTAERFVALQDLLLDKELDRVARREISERATMAKTDLMEQLNTAFFPPSQHATWRLWVSGIPKDAEEGDIIEGRSLSALASVACDRAFAASPHVRNEMLGRTELTSQGAKARRELLTAMLTRSGERYLGIVKYPAERAMYSGALAYMGLHRENTAVTADDGATSILPYGFSRPGPQHAHAQPVWAALENALTDAHERTSLDQIFRVLARPPYGVKEGVIPLLVVTALIIRGEDVALFEEGTYRPRLTADIVERIVKAPYRFEVKSTPVGDGLRASVVKKLTKTLDVDAPRSQALRNPALLAVARALLERIMVLTPYGRKTRRLSKDAVAVRAALFQAQDPDDLLFRLLPQALDMDPITPEMKKSTPKNKGFAERLTAAVQEISEADSALRAEVVQVISKEFRLSSTLTRMRKELAARLKGFEGVYLTTELRGFVSIALNTTLDDKDWLEPIVVRLTNSALGDWSDTDAQAFPSRVREIAQALDRVSHLHQSPNGDDGQEEALDTRLLTLTGRDGSEQRTLLYVPEKSQQEAQELAVRAMRQAEEMLGADGARILLAALAQHVTTPATPTDDGKD
ncbi:ATP-binding protein [Nocardiopsis sp. NPDC006139]|uniref:ATP-binding protein n=1 Tax=Nocardiopsis sp. NPDC006139 TaxID=3154578 RepID=UPI0033B7F22B